MVSCLLCVSLLVNYSKVRYITKADAQSHANQHFLQTKHFDEVPITLDQVFEHCFPNFAVAPLAKIKTEKTEGRQALLELCYALFNGRISEASPSATCQLCGSETVLYYKKGGKGNQWKSEVAIAHASRHLKIDLFECRKCESSFRSRSTVIHHLMISHHVRGLTEYYADKSCVFIDEISASIKDCFSEDNGSSDKKTPMIGIRNETAVQSSPKGSKLAVERHLFCYRFIRQLAGEDRKIQCRLCGKRISIENRKRYRGKRAMAHAHVHLKQPVYRCEVCCCVRHSWDLMQYHLKSTHALPMLKNFVCLEDEFHSEIMTILRECYGDKSVK